MKKLLIIFTFLLPFLLLPSIIQALTINIMADTHNVSVNALEATIEVPKSVVSLKVLDGNSPILFWVKRATFDSTSHTISFAGVTPGGFAGQGVILSLEGDFGLDDYKLIRFSNISAFKNDGQGTPTLIKLSAANGGVVEDNLPPEPFNIVIGEAEEIFNNRKFLSFIAQDKGTGIDHYELNGKIVESPTPLSKFNLFQRLTIKAVDKAGNVREQSTVGPYYYYLWSFIWVIIISTSLWVLFQIRRFLG